jgi:hypothetical protein
MGIYPISMITALSERERIMLFDLDIILCIELLEQERVLVDIGIPHSRHSTIVEEAQMICSLMGSKAA